MSQINKLRIATDFSEHAAQARARAVMVAKNLSLTGGVLVHALESHRVRAVRDLLPVIASLEKHHQQEAEKVLAEAADALTAETGIDFIAMLREGEASDAVLEDLSLDELVVLGNRGAHSVRDLALGSTAERVVRKSAAPVLVVKRVPRDAYTKVVVGVDFSDDSLPCLKLAKTLAPDATIQLVHALPPISGGLGRFGGVSQADVSQYATQLREVSEKRMDELVAAAGLAPGTVERVIEQAYAPQLIWEQAHAVGADLVVIGKHGHSPMRDWLMGSVTSHVVAECAADILVLGDSSPA